MLDTNLLLVLLAGRVNPARLAEFKRVKHYTKDDYDLLVRFLKRFKTLVATPHILTEVSNLAPSRPDRQGADWTRYFAELTVGRQGAIGIHEEMLPELELSQRTEFANFGLADAGIAYLASSALIVTDDHPLCGHLRKQKASVLNFDDLRQMQRQLWAPQR